MKIGRRATRIGAAVFVLSLAAHAADFGAAKTVVTSAKSVADFAGAACAASFHAGAHKRVCQVKGHGEVALAIAKSTADNAGVAEQLVNLKKLSDAKLPTLEIGDGIIAGLPCTDGKKQCKGYLLSWVPNAGMLLLLRDNNPTVIAAIKKAAGSKAAVQRVHDDLAVLHAFYKGGGLIGDFQGVIATADNHLVVMDPSDVKQLDAKQRGANLTYKKKLKAFDDLMSKLSTEIGKMQ